MFDKFQHMAKKPLEERDAGIVADEEPHYSYNLALSLDHEDLETVGLDCNDSDCEVGNYIHLEVLAKVTGVHKTDSGDGAKNMLNLQITHMCINDEESHEEPDDDEAYEGKEYRKSGPY